MTRLEVQLLGFPSLRLDGRGVDLALRKGLGLIAYLADARAPVGRDHVAGLLWPEADTEAARGRLRRTLHKIRTAFTVDLIDADRTSLAFAPSIEARIDAHAFEAACFAGELNEALGLYAGDFLQGLSIEGCGAFEEWTFFRREALRSRLVQTLERLISRELVAGDARAAMGPCAMQRFRISRPTSCALFSPRTSSVAPSHHRVAPRTTRQRAERPASRSLFGQRVDAPAAVSASYPHNKECPN